MIRIASLAAVLAVAALPAEASSAMVTTWYEAGHTTASGMAFRADNPRIAAHKRLPFGTRILLINPANKKRLCVEVQDRGPFVRGKELDVTRAGADALGFRWQGVATLEARVGGC